MLLKWWRVAKVGDDVEKIIRHHWVASQCRVTLTHGVDLVVR